MQEKLNNYNGLHFNSILRLCHLYTIIHERGVTDGREGDCMKKKILIGLFVCLILATVIGTVVLSVDSYNYDMDPQNGLDIFEGVDAVLILIVGGFVVFYELDLWYTVHYFLFREKTLAKSVLNLLSNLTFLSVFLCTLFESNSPSVKTVELTLMILFGAYLILRVIYISLAYRTTGESAKIKE